MKNKELAQIPPASGEEPTPYRHRMALNTVARVREELAKIYRAARNGELPLSDATRLTYILDRLARMIIENELEARIVALEQTTSAAREYT